MNARNACLYERLGLILPLTGLFILCAEGLATTLPAPATGASVDESRVQKTYYVDAASADAADDDKHGIVDAPFATMSYACGVAVREKEHNVGTKLIIAAGVYREAVEVCAPSGGAPDTDAPLVIEAAERAQAVIDGADTEGWTPSTWKMEGANWTHLWPFRRNAAQQAAWTRSQHAASAPPSASGEAYRRGDFVLINGNPLRQVNRLEELAPACFWGRAAAVPAAGGKPAPDASAGPVVVVQPPPDTPLTGSIIQVGTRNRGLAIYNRRNVVVRGLLLQHAAGPSDPATVTTGLLLDGCSNVLIDDVICQWNDGTGLVVTGSARPPWSTDLTLREVHLLHNGGSGLYAANIKNLLVVDSEACFNNFRGEWADWNDTTGPAGVRTSGVHGSTWRRLRAVGNFCRGVWWDGDNSDATLEDGALRGNLLSGLCIENDPGPVLVRRCLVAETKSSPGAHDESARPAGVSTAGTPDLTLESNVMAGNAAAQLGLWDTPTHGGTADFENRASKPDLHAERHTYRHNVFYGADASQPTYNMPVPESGGKTVSVVYYGTLVSSENCFWNSSQAETFLLHAAAKPTGGSTPGAHPGVNMDGWRALLQAHVGADKAVEAGSFWQDPLFVDPAEGDFRVREQSPAADWNLPSDEGSASP